MSSEFVPSFEATSQVRNLVTPWFERDQINAPFFKNEKKVQALGLALIALSVLMLAFAITLIALYYSKISFLNNWQSGVCIYTFIASAVALSIFGIKLCKKEGIL